MSKVRPIAAHPSWDAPKPNLIRCAIYARVSTEDQDCQIQLDELRGYVQRSGWEAEEYTEKLSGKEGNRRPQLERLLADARMKRFQIVLVWKMDRFGRSTLDTLENIRILESSGVAFICPTMGIDTRASSPTGKFILTVFAAIAELERSFIVERTQKGLQSYRKDFALGKVGKTRHSKSGKDLPVGRPKNIFRRDRAKQLRDDGLSWRQIEKIMQVPQATIRRALKSVA